MEPRPSSQFDLSKPPKGFKVKIESHELPAELVSRLWKEKGDAWVQWGKEAILFLAAIAGVGFIVVACFRIATNPGGSPEDKKWATSILASIVSGVVGYLIRGKSGS
jgi:hypothetical protein